MTDQYAIATILLLRTSEEKPARAKIIKEIHLVDGLKANMLIGNDILGLEQISIMIPTKTAHIGNCYVTVPIDIKTRSAAQARSIHSKKVTLVPPLSEIEIPVHNFASLPDRDYLFESAETRNLSLYAHIIGTDTKTVIARNNCDTDIRIPSYFRLGKLVE